MLINCGLGVITVVLIGLIGRRLGGNRVGLIAATAAALYPNLWSWNGTVLSESTAVLCVAVTLFFAYRWLDRRRPLDLWLTAIAVGFSALARSELILFGPFLLVPMVVGEWRRTHDTKGVARQAGIGVALVLLVLLPWAALNTSR